jgi:hypothetical protein
MKQQCPRCKIGFLVEDLTYDNSRIFKAFSCEKCDMSFFTDDVDIYYFECELVDCGACVDMAMCSHYVFVVWDVNDKSTEVYYHGKFMPFDKLLPFDLSLDRIEKLLLLK